MTATDGTVQDRRPGSVLVTGGASGLGAAIALAVQAAGGRPFVLDLVAPPFEVDHPSGAPPHALRVEYGGRVVAYSGDTQWTDQLVDAARDADLFVCEAYTFDRPIRFHLDHATLRAHRERLTARRIILTHLGPEMLARARDAAWQCASDGLAVSL